MRNSFFLRPIVERIRDVRDQAAAKRAGDMQLYRHRKADAFIVSYPKSGRSWLRVMLAHYFCNVMGRPYSPNLDIAERTSSTPNAPRGAFVHDVTTHENEPNYTATQLPDDRSFYRGRRVVLLVRDLRDVMASYYMHATRRQQAFTGSISAFIRDDRFGIAKPVRFLNIWYVNRHVPRELMLLRYEDLSCNTVGELLRLVQFLGFPVSFDAAREAARFARFENMQAMERAGALAADNRFGAGRASDENSYKVRKGRVGGFINELSPEDVRMLSDYIDAELSPWFGYCGLFRDEVQAKLAA